ncbi:MAG: hypothetical protein WC792_02365 [Candidatus Micrarchaeia archaeon]|jgi:thiol-disulfide isomerase/thioredoxin
MAKLTEFWGRECPHCAAMAPLVERLKKEENVEIDQLEVWHDEKNQEEMRKHEALFNQACGGFMGTPAFLNSETGEALCGEQDYAALKKWATKKK